MKPKKQEEDGAIIKGTRVFRVGRFFPNNWSGRPTFLLQVLSVYNGDSHIEKWLPPYFEVLSKSSAHLQGEMQVNEKTAYRLSRSKVGLYAYPLLNGLPYIYGLTMYSQKA